jgi:aldehyde dehydrogenase (NAD+)
MQAAAKHLTSVTLELGGKSPTIIDETANIDKAADRIASTKMLNNGQTCIAPDYVLVHESVKEKLIARIKEKLQALYTPTPQDSPDYERMVNQRHFERVKGYVADALAHNATIEIGGHFDDESRFIAPTVVTNVPDHAQLMQEEIFGPVLPILTFKTLEEVIQRIRQKEKPLALYIFSTKEKHIQYLLKNTTAGGTCINHSSVHFLNHELPFGGVNNSGIGKGHGFSGFEAFSNKRAVLRQWAPLSATDLLQPPYKNWKQKMIDLTIKWL